MVMIKYSLYTSDAWLTIYIIAHPILTFCSSFVILAGWFKDTFLKTHLGSNNDQEYSVLVKTYWKFVVS